MPSNKDLITSIAEVSNEKGVDVPQTEGLNNNQLTATLKNLKALPPKPLGADEQAVINKAAKDKAKADAKKKPPFYVSDGKSITTLKGLLSEGDEIKAEYFRGGKDRLKELVKDKVVSKG